MPGSQINSFFIVTAVKIRGCDFLIPAGNVDRIGFDHRAADNFHLFMFVDMAACK